MKEGKMIKDYTFFNGDIIKFSYNGKNILYKVIKDPENIFTTKYELKPFEYYENSVNKVWDLKKLKKVNIPLCVFNFFVFKNCRRKYN